MLSLAWAGAGAQDLDIVLNWGDSSETPKSSQAGSNRVWFEGAYESEIDPSIPEYRVRKMLKSADAELQAELRNPIFETIDAPEWQSKVQLPSSPALTVETFTLEGRPAVDIAFLPIVQRADGTFAKLITATIVFSQQGAKSRQVLPSIEFADNSRLSSGIWFRLGIPRDGVYRLTRDEFTQAGINVGAIDPNDINVYAHDAGMLSYVNAEYNQDDMKLKASHFEGGDDGSFDAGDYLLFYAKGPHRWQYDETDEMFEHTKHLYMNEAYCFIGIGVDPAKRMTDADLAESPASHVVNTFDDYRFHEEDLESVIKSGRRMAGERFGLSQSLSYTGEVFSYENIDTDAIAKIKVRGLAATFGSGNISRITVSSQSASETMDLAGFSSGSYSVTRAREVVLAFEPIGGNLTVNTEFQPAGSDSRGWIDYLTVNVRRRLESTVSQFGFRDITSVGAGNIAEYAIGNMSAAKHVWEVTNPAEAQQVSYVLEGNTAQFKAESDSLRDFVLFDLNSIYTPSSFISIENQNLHAAEAFDMVIVTASPFKSVADKVADLHRSEGLSVVVLEPQIIYNEFSGGMQDITAIKMYMKMLYDRAAGDAQLRPDYLLLIGDGNYNHTEIAPGSIYLPAYQSLQSETLTSSYISDDYFGLLDDDESEGSGTVDVGIGRFPVRTLAEAEGIYGKLVRYISAHTGVVAGTCSENAATPYGDWRNKVLVIGDDEDSNRHMIDADALTGYLQEVNDDYIVNKVYLDAYLQDITPGGARYPQATEEIQRSIEEGVFLVSYTGHGGEVGWAEERIIDVPTIQNFSNSYAMPLMLTATCEFSRFDDPGRTSAGEFTLLNANGGVIGLLTTTRLVYSQPNFILSRNFYDLVSRKDAEDYTCLTSATDFDLPNGLRLGDIIRITKNCTAGNTVNKANFSLLGDPALRLSYPELTVVTDSITDVNGARIDTIGIKALQRVRFHGKIVNSDSVLQADFQGQVQPSVYDKSEQIQTLQNDGGSAFQFEARENILYNGRATVADGQFEFEFIVPRDISYQEGRGKVYYYGLGNDTDAQGSSGGFAVGGTDSTAVEDALGPVVQLYLESEAFVNGGLTSTSPLLIAKITDENGINTVGNGIGHDITAVLDGNTSDPIVLNEYFELDLDSYQQGELQYKLSDLEEGDHSLRFKVWDIYNNSSVVEVQFKVKPEVDLSLANVVNYPNPFTTHTEFLFEHNQTACAALDVRVEVFTVSGRLVKTIHSVVDSHKTLRDQITWDGRDDFGDRLGRGVYVYRLQVTTPEGEKEEVFEKLVIL